MKNIVQIMLKPAFALLFLGFWSASHAQQDANSSLYLFNRLPYNPAVTADGGEQTATMHYRNQWMNLKGAPKTLNVNFQTPFLDNRNALGISITADKIGMMQTNAAMITYAYHIPVGKNTHFSMGFQGGVEHFRVDWTKAEAYHEADGAYPDYATNDFQMNIGVGAMLKSNKYYVGVSVPKVLPGALYSDDYLGSNKYGSFRLAHLMGGLNLKVTDNVQFIPSALFKVARNVPFETELAGQLVFNNNFAVGANYRAGDSVDAFAKVNLSQHIQVGFSWDVTTSKVRSFNDGGFDVMLQYVFGSKSEKMNDLRFF